MYTVVKKVVVFGMIPFIAFSCMSEDEIKAKAEKEAKFLVEKEGRMAKGLGEGLKGEGKEGVTALAEGVGEVFKGAGEGFDKSLAKVDVRMDDGLKEFVELGRTAKTSNDSLNTTVVSVYLACNKGYEGKLLLKAFDAENLEIGRKTVDVKLATDDAEYFDFEFDERTPLNIATYFTLNKK